MSNIAIKIVKEIKHFKFKRQLLVQKTFLIKLNFLYTKKYFFMLMNAIY